MESVFNKVAGLQAPIQVFSCEICEIFKNTFFYRTPPVISGKIEILPEKHKIPQTITNEALQRRQGNSWFLYRCKNFRILIFVVYFWKQKINFGNSILISNFFKTIHSITLLTTWKLFVFEVSLARTFLHSDRIRRYIRYLSIFILNAGKYGPEKLWILTLFSQWLWLLMFVHVSQKDFGKKILSIQSNVVFHGFILIPLLLTFYGHHKYF